MDHGKRERIILIFLVGLFAFGLALRLAHPDSIQIKRFRVDLNQASTAELDALPGIGPRLARRIIAFRDSIGGFESLEQMVLVRGISKRTLEKLRPFLRPIKGD
ncbi:MAG TPA: helix-hairpin-helix domain-containing protein [bacterium (Candidatus Stahlbacteria)]|nr:helix-hairpin-helix domain-containing protein [Candidatus Stahlbacteria bacterium]